MPRPARQQQKSQTPLDRQQEQIQAELAKLRGELQKQQQFLDGADDLRAAAEKREQQELINRFRGRVRVEGPADTRYDLRSGYDTPVRRTLRKERSKAPLLTAVLFLTFGLVVFYACRILLHS